MTNLFWRKKLVVVIVGIIVVLVGVALLLINSRVGVFRQENITFVEGFRILGEIDAEYNASFHDERINGTVIALENVDPILVEVKEFRERLLRAENTSDRDALLLLSEIRVGMLESERNWILAQQIGDIGIVTDEDGSVCAEIEYILTAANYYNLSWDHGKFLASNLDDLLYHYRNVTGVRDLVGINENKPRWYYGPLDHVKNMWRNNVLAMQEFCGYDPAKQTVTVAYKRERS